MTNIVKITSFTLLIVFIGLFSFGLMVDDITSQHMSHVDCFGAGCGSVEHVVMHGYLVSSRVDERKNIAFYQYTFVFNESAPQTLEVDIESPPPKSFLV